MTKNKKKPLITEERISKWIDHTYEVNVASMRGQIDFSLLLIKSLITINAGAIAALVAFMATIWKDNDKAFQSNINEGTLFFIVGLYFAVCTGYFAYLAQSKCTFSTPFTNLDFSYVNKKNKEIEEKFLFWKKISRVFGFLSFLISMAGFVYIAYVIRFMR